MSDTEQTWFLVFHLHRGSPSATVVTCDGQPFHPGPRDEVERRVRDAGYGGTLLYGQVDPETVRTYPTTIPGMVRPGIVEPHTSEKLVRPKRKPAE